MRVTWLVYGVVLLLFFAGILFVKWEKYERTRWRSLRWRVGMEKVFRSFEIWKEKESLFFRRLRRGKRESELYEALSYLRNAIVLGNGRGIGSDPLIEELGAKGGALAPVFGKALRFLRQNQKEEAYQCLKEELEDVGGTEFSRILMAWEDMDPVLLTESLFSCQKGIRESRVTERKKRDEMASDLVYLPVVLNVMLVFLNFVYVGYFIDQKEMLTMLL